MNKFVFLSYDISRCAVTEQNANCSMARQCLRRLDGGRDSYQTFTAFKGGIDCDGFIQAKGDDK